MNYIQRTNYYIKEDFQRKFIIKFCMLVTLACVFSGILIYLMSTSSVTTAFENSRLVIKSTSDYMLPVIGFTCCFIIVCISSATIFVVKRISHALAGPLYRFEQQAKKIADGDLSATISLRKTDELQELAAQLNEMIVDLRLSIESMIADVKAIKEHVPHDQAELAKIVENLDSKLHSFKLKE